MNLNFNWDSITNGVPKTHLRLFLNGNIGTRALIGKAKTKIAKSELYRLERNLDVRNIRKLMSRNINI